MADKQKVWESDDYYKLASRGSMDKDHPGMKRLFEYAKGANKILDFGCGEGTRLGLLFSKGKKLCGIDISKKAISHAKKKYPKIEFIQGKIGKTGLGRGYDLIYSAFVLEHTRNTEKILLELINKLKNGGYLLLVAPNYGAPNRASPVAKYGRVNKLIIGFVNDILATFKKGKKLNWREVEPAKNIKYEMDFDTTIEPYLKTLIDFLSINNMKVKEADSVWSRELESAKIQQKLFRFLGEKGIYPFKYWGPHLLVVAEKL